MSEKSDDDVTRTHPVLADATEVVAADEERDELPVVREVDVAHREVCVLHLRQDVLRLPRHRPVRRTCKQQTQWRHACFDVSSLMIYVFYHAMPIFAAIIFLFTWFGDVEL